MEMVPSQLCITVTLLSVLELVVQTDGRTVLGWFADSDDSGNDESADNVGTAMFKQIPSLRPGYSLYISNGNIYEYGPEGSRVLPSLYDPSTFTDVIRSCQAGCGDAYYNCCFYDCASEDYDVQKKQTFKSKLLWVVTFGLIDPEQYAIQREMACLQSCRQTFRSCYRKCICDWNFNFAKYFCKT